MRIYLQDQSKNFKRHLDVLKLRKVMQFDKSKLKEKISFIELGNSNDFERVNLDFLFNYQIFPETIMTYFPEWVDDERTIKVGDTIVQQVFIPPVKGLSQKIVFGVRITEIIDKPNQKGFSYETLEGHVEKGVSTFTIEQNEGKLIFKIQTYSKPGNLLTQIMAPIFSLPYQTYCTKKALMNVNQEIEKQLRPEIDKPTA